MHADIPADLFILSHSKNKALATCALVFRRHYIDRAPELANAPGETGSGFHDWAHRLSAATRPGAPVDEGLAVELLRRKAALLDEPAAVDLRQLVRRYMERGGLPGFPGDAQDVAFEHRVAVDEQGRICGWSDPAALYRGILDQRYRENGGELAVVRDWKTSRIIENPGEQMRGYGWLQACEFPDVEEIVVELHYVRFPGPPRKEVLGAAELRAEMPAAMMAIRDEIRRRVRDDDWTPRVSDHCRVCSYTASCPRFTGRVEPFKRVTTPEEAREAADQLAILRGQASALEKALKAWCRVHGNVDCDDETLGWIERETERVVDTRLAARLLRAHVSDDDVWAALGLGKTALGKLLTLAISKLPRTQRADAREALMQGLREAGALEEAVSTTFKRAKKQAEVLDEDQPDDE